MNSLKRIIIIKLLIIELISEDVSYIFDYNSSSI